MNIQAIEFSFLGKVFPLLVVSYPLLKSLFDWILEFVREKKSFR